MEEDEEEVAIEERPGMKEELEVHCLDEEDRSVAPSGIVLEGDRDEVGCWNHDDESAFFGEANSFVDSSCHRCAAHSVGSLLPQSRDHQGEPSLRVEDVFARVLRLIRAFQIARSCGHLFQKL